MTYLVTETCQNGKERELKKKVYANCMYRFDEGKQELEKRGYYKIIMVDAKWEDVIFIQE